MPKNINLITLHSGIWSFANNTFDIFGAIYLLKLGISFPIIVLIMACSNLIRLFIRPLSIFISEKLGLRNALILGTLISSGMFLVLSQVSGVGIWLYLYIFYIALHDVSYWLPYHAYYAHLGDIEKRGKQIGKQTSVVCFFKIFAPIINGFILTKYGFNYLCLSSTIIMIISIIPLFFIKNESYIKTINWIKTIKEINKDGMILQIGGGIMYSHIFIWNIVLYYMVGNFMNLGWLATFELLLTMVLVSVLGHFIDKGKGAKIYKIGIIMMSIIILARGIWVHNIYQSIIINILVAISSIFYYSTASVCYYNLNKKSGNVLWFNFFGELGFDIGAIVGFSLSALLFCIGIPLQYIILVSLPGLFVVNYVLNKYFK